MLLLSQLTMTARAGLALALLCLLPLPVLAQKTIYVDGNCTLGKAFESANASTFVGQGAPEVGSCEHGDTDPNDFDTIVLNRDVWVAHDTTDSASASSKIILDGNDKNITGDGGTNGAEVNVLTVASGGDLTVKNVDIKNTTPGGAATSANVFINVASGGRATIQNVKFQNTVTRNNVTNAVVGLSNAGGIAHVWHSRFEKSRSTGVKPVVSGAGTTVYRSVLRDNQGDRTGFVVTNATISSSTITENKATGSTPNDTYAVSGAKLRNVTLAYNDSAGIYVPQGMKNSILYANDGPECGGTFTAASESLDWGPNSVQDHANNSDCLSALRRDGLAVLTRSPDIDDDISHDSYYPLDPGADAIGYGSDCEVADQNGDPYGPNPCDLGAITSWDPAAGQPAPGGPSPTPNLTRTPFHTPVPTATVTPTPYPTVDGWMLFSDYEGVLAKTVTAAGVGIAHIVELGFISAIDIWGEVGWGVTACHTQYSNGTFVFLDAAGMPREAVTWPAAPPINGMACTYIESEGTLVMLRAQPWSEPPTPTPRESLPSFGPPTPVQLQGCKLLTRDMVNLRAEEWGDVLTIIPYETELTAMEVTEEFYKVTFEEQAGYVHRDWVSIVAGVCAAPAEE